MRKILFSMSILLAWTASLPAQITREQADIIALDFLKSEVVQEGALYVNDKTPDEESITLITSKEEIINVKYACWVYFLNESESTRSYYLLVKANNGSLLEIVTSNDLGPSDLTSWIAVRNTSSLTEKENPIKTLYQDPATGLLTIPCSGDYTHVKIYDLKGACLFSKLLSKEGTSQLNVSFLIAGTYMVSADGETYKIIKN